MNIETIMKAISDVRKSSAGNLTIGKFLEKLNKFDDSDSVTFSNGKYFDGTWDSYRGYYEDMYIGWSDVDKGFNDVGKIKETLIAALETGVMHGYKGGDYSVNNDTLVWMASYSHLGDMIVDVQKINRKIYVITKEEEW